MVFPVLTTFFKTEGGSPPAGDTISGDYSTGLRAYFSLEGNANDATGSYNATNNGAVSAIGKVGNCLDFDGVNDYVSLANDTIPPTGDFSVSCWINLDSVAAGHIVDMKSSTVPYFRIDVQLGNLRAEVYGGNLSTTYVFAPSTITLSTSTWYHVVFTFDRTNKEGKLYINGSLDVTDGDTYTGTMPTLDSSPQEVGRRVNGTNYTEGKIDELGIWTTVLTATQVSGIYNSGTGIPYS